MQGMSHRNADKVGKEVKKLIKNVVTGIADY